MTDRAALEELAVRVEACVEDAKREEVLADWGGNGIITRSADPRIVSLANGLEAVAAALRAIATTPEQQEKPNDGE